MTSSQWYTVTISLSTFRSSAKS